MAIHYRTQGIFLKKEEKGEADFLFTIYTKDFGKLDILGKAIRKIKSKLRAGAREFCWSEIEFIQGKTYKTLTDAILIKEFRDIKTDLEKLKIVYQIADVLDNLVSGEERDEKIWDLVLQTFQWLNNKNQEFHPPKFSEKTWAGKEIRNQEIVYHFFVWNLLAILGYSPRLYNCPICERKLEPEKLYWSSEEGGIVCGECSNKKSEESKLQKIDVDIVKIIRLLLQKNWQTVNKLRLSLLHLEQLKTISDDYFSYVSGEALDTN